MVSKVGNAGRISSRARNRTIAVIVGIGGVLVLVALGYVFSTSSGAQQVAENARSLHAANAAAGSAAIVRASVAQAVVFGIDHELGVASEESRDAAFSEANARLSDSGYWARVLSDDDATSGVGSDLALLTATGREIMAHLTDGNSIAGERVRIEAMEPLYDDISASLSDRQLTIAAEINRTERFAGAVGWIARLLVTLLIPAAAIIAYFFLARRQLREAKVKLDAKLKAERQLSIAKDEFIAGISHELRTPLTSIYGFSEYLLENEILDPDEAMELLGLINKDSAELSRMVDDLLTAARMEADALTYNYEYVNLRAETDAAIGPMVRAASPVRISGEVTAWADPVRVRQIVRNLVSNAIKHGGDPVGVYLESSGNEAIVTVSDSGPGLTKDVEDRLFDRFVHDGSESLLMGSVGLGLSIARSLAQTMGGDIRFVRAGGWTNFEVTLPLKEGSAPPSVPEQESGHRHDPRAEAIMAGQS